MIMDFLGSEKAACTEHLSYEELAGYVDGTLDDKEKADVLAHADKCPACLKELKIFGVLKLESELDNRRHARPKKLKSIKSLLRKPVDGKVLGLAVLLILTSLLAFVSLRWNRARIENLRSSLSRVAREKEALGKKLETIAPGIVDGKRRFVMDASGKPLGADVWPADYRVAIQDALTTGHVATPPAPQTEYGMVGQRRGLPTQSLSTDLLYPVGTTVQETRPGFEWRALRGAGQYTVLLRDLTTGEESEGRPTTGPTWKPERDLIRGHEYAWMLETRVDGNYVRIPASNVPPPAFRVVDAQQAQEIETMRESCGDSHLVKGVVYAKAGMMREAEQEFKALVAANPESPVAKRLLAGISTSSVGGRPQK